MNRSSSHAAPLAERQTNNLPGQLAAAWPRRAWADVHVLAAVSGGADSVALLRALVAAQQASAGAAAGRVFAAHVNHGLRGSAADDDEAWLGEQCRRLNAPLLVRRGDAAAIAREQGDGIEAAARAVRYRLLTEMAEEAGARFVATAHTRDDQVETVLFRLLRGSGLHGLAGMRPFRPLSSSVTLARPLLACTRDDVLAYLDELAQPWREDSTNATAKFARNRIRNELLPLIREQVSADADAAILRAATQAREAQELIGALVEELFVACRVAATPAGISLLAPPLAGRPPLLVVEVLRRAWREAAWSEQAMTHRGWRQLAGMVQGVESTPAGNLPGNVRARRAGEWLVLEALGR